MRPPYVRATPTTTPTTRPTTMESRLSSIVISSALARNGRRSRSGVKSMSKISLSCGKGGSLPRPYCASLADIRSGTALQHAEFFGGYLVLDLVIDGLQPVVEDGVGLVDREADVGRHLRTLQTGIAQREHHQARYLLRQVRPSRVVDRRNVGALRHDLLDRSVGPGAGDALELQFLEARRRPGFRRRAREVR